MDIEEIELNIIITSFNINPVTNIISFLSVIKRNDKEKVAHF